MSLTSASARTRRSLLGGSLLAGAGIFALAASLAAANGLPTHKNAPAPVYSVGATYKTFPTLATLSRASTLIAIAKVAAPGKTFLILPPRPLQLPPGPPKPEPGDPPKKISHTTRPTFSPVPLQGAIGLPATTFRIGVLETLRGQAPAGRLISLTQLGGTLPTAPKGMKQTIQDEHDPLMVPGQPQILFLGQNGDGSMYVVGGGQGRFVIDGGRVFPADRTAPIAKGHIGEPLQAFEQELKRAQG